KLNLASKNFRIFYSQHPYILLAFIFTSFYCVLSMAYNVSGLSEVAEGDLGGASECEAEPLNLLMVVEPSSKVD
ncbi:MAG: hypothetical protein DRO76_04405, partial [Candidatus Altiarchaeales archaeon]